MPFTPISIIIREGVNYKICQKLEMNNTKFLISKNERKLLEWEWLEN